MFHAEMDNLKSKMENDFARQKSKLLEDFDIRLQQEKLNLNSQHEKLMDENEEKLKREMESLKVEFEVKKKELEEELRAQFSADIQFLRQELEKAKNEQKTEIIREIVVKSEPEEEKSSKAKSKHHACSVNQGLTIFFIFSAMPTPAARSTKKSPPKASPSFLNEIEGLEADIRKLRSQVKIGMLHMESDETSSDEDVYSKYEQKFFHPPELMNAHQQSPQGIFLN